MEDPLERFRSQVFRELEDFIASNENERPFPVYLDFDQRKNVHILASRLGLKHFSTGEGDQRYITVVKPRNFRPRNFPRQDRQPDPREHYENYQQPQQPDDRPRNKRYRDSERGIENRYERDGYPYHPNARAHPYPDTHRNPPRDDYRNDTRNDNLRASRDREDRENFSNHFNTNRNFQEFSQHDNRGWENNANGDRRYENNHYTNYEPNHDYRDNNINYNNNNYNNNFNNNNYNNPSNNSFEDENKLTYKRSRQNKIYRTHFTEEDADRPRNALDDASRPPNVRGRGNVRWGFYKLEMDDKHAGKEKEDQKEDGLSKKRGQPEEKPSSLPSPRTPPDYPISGT